MEYNCPFCDDFETDYREYLQFHWSEGDCLGPDQEDLEWFLDK